MTRFGYTLMTEQSGPRELVELRRSTAERVGLRLRGLQRSLLALARRAQGHAPYAWTVLGAVAQATTTSRAGDVRDVPDPCATTRRGGTKGGCDPPDPLGRSLHPRASAPVRTSTST